MDIAKITSLIRALIIVFSASVFSGPVYSCTFETGYYPINYWGWYIMLALFFLLIVFAIRKLIGPIFSILTVFVIAYFYYANEYLAAGNCSGGIAERNVEIISLALAVFLGGMALKYVKNKIVRKYYHGNTNN